MSSQVFSKKQLEQIGNWRKQKWTWWEIYNAINYEWDVECTPDSVRLQFQRYGVKDKKGATKASLPLKPAKRAKSAKARKEDNRRILVISDMHVPYQHPDTVAFLKAVKDKYKPTRVINIGDEVDKHALSFHNSDPDLFSAGHELQEAIKQLQPIYEMFPYMDLVDSNHGSLAYRKGKHHGIPRKYLKDYGDVLEAPPGWQWHPELIVTLPTGEKCFFHHGLAADIMKVVNQRSMCAVQGHYHSKFTLGYSSNPASLLWGMTVGCLIDGHSLAFAYDRNNLGRPIKGLGIIIDGLPKLLPMVLDDGGRWNGVVP